MGNITERDKRLTIGARMNPDGTGGTIIVMIMIGIDAWVIFCGSSLRSK
jgi:hypothetical protein